MGKQAGVYAMPGQQRLEPTRACIQIRQCAHYALGGSSPISHVLPPGALADGGSPLLVADGDAGRQCVDGTPDELRVGLPIAALNEGATRARLRVCAWTHVLPRLSDTRPPEGDGGG